MATAEMNRYGREMYLAGNYTEAVKTFKKVLSMDCSNTLAQYHLRQIMRKGWDSKELGAYFNSLPCANCNFPEEDFVAAAILYTRDPEILQEQILAYNKRFRNSQADLTRQVISYAEIAENLDEKISYLENALAAANEEQAQTELSLNQKLQNSQNRAETMSAELQKLSTELNSLRLASSQPPAEKADTAPSELQAKLSDIQKRLSLVQIDIQNRNEQLRALVKKLQEQP